MRKRVRQVIKVVTSVGTSLCIATVFAIIILRRNAQDRRDMRP